MEYLDYDLQRKIMVYEQLEARGIDDKRVLWAMGEVKRELFVPEDIRTFSYYDGPLPIDYGQTISQPYIVASMAEFLDLEEEDRVLEIGTGSGYNTAILSLLTKEVYSIEIQPGLAVEAADRLRSLGYLNIKATVGDGLRGWRKHAPFDKIIVTAALTDSPAELIDQLAPNGRLVVPEGRDQQFLYLYQKLPKGSELIVEKSMLIPVKFAQASEQGDLGQQDFGQA